MQNQIALGTQMLNLAYNGKNASEHREKEQSVRVDKVLEQLAAANKRQESMVAITPSPKPVLDIGMLVTKSMQANSNLLEAQSKVMQQDGELRNKSSEILAVNEKLKSLQAEFEASQTSLADLEGQYQRVRGQADGALQRNIRLKEQLEYLASNSLQAARVPQLLEDLAAKDAEISQLRSEAAKVDGLVQTITGKDRELKQLQEQADRVPGLTMALTGRDTELERLRPEAKRVPALTQELGQLREEISAMSPLKEKLASAEAELNGLRTKTAQFDRKNADNVLFQSQIRGLTENVQTLEQQLGPLKKTASEFVELQKVNIALTAKVASMQSLQEKLKASQREVGTFKREIVALQLTFGDYDQMKKDLGAQKDVHAKQVAHASGLQSRLQEVQTRADQVPDLQGRVCELSQKCGSLNQQLSDATKAAEECQLLKNDIEQKNNEIASLKSMLKNIEQQQEDDQSSTRASNHVQHASMRLGHAHDGPVIGDSQEKAEMSSTDTNGPRQVADPQPQFNRPSSSSESMLLEQFEAAEELLLESQVGQETETPLSQRQSHENTTQGVDMRSRRLRNSLSSQTLEDVPPGPWRLRSGISSQVIEESQFQVQQPSTPILASSSPAGPRNLPNSGIKRPRLDPIEATLATQPTKRLKRTPANLEVKTTRPPSSASTQSAEPERPAQASLPTGSRKGSVIGANAPAPGKAVGRKTTRNGSRNDRYAERFSKE
jgi:DNA repair exonuclease SbcCD ATPase subunit